MYLGKPEMHCVIVDSVYASPRSEGISELGFGPPLNERNEAISNRNHDAGLENSSEAKNLQENAPLMAIGLDCLAERPLEIVGPSPRGLSPGDCQYSLENCPVL